MSIIEIYNTHCCGEIGDVIVAGDIKLEGDTIFQQSKYKQYIEDILPEKYMEKY